MKGWISMDLQNDFKYSEKVTKEHPLSCEYDQCIKSLNDVVVNDFETEEQKTDFLEGTPFRDELVLDVDAVEIEKCRGTSEFGKTADFVFGASNGKESEMIVVENKLNVTNVNNVKYRALIGKYEHTSELLGNSTNISDYLIVTFANGLKEQAKHRFRRTNLGKLSSRMRVANSLLDYFCPEDR